MKRTTYYLVMRIQKRMLVDGVEHSLADGEFYSPIFSSLKEAKKRFPKDEIKEVFLLG